MLKVCCGVTNRREKDGGYKRSGRTPVRGAESDGSPAMCLSVRACVRYNLRVSKVTEGESIQAN